MLNKCQGCNKQRELKEIENKFDPKRVMLPDVIHACDECYMVFEATNKSVDSLTASQERLEETYKECGIER